MYMEKDRIKNERKRNILIALIYFGFYFVAFGLLEKIEVPIHVIHSRFDNYIPFCEYFIIFYASWFVLLVVTILYYALAPGKGRQYHNMILSVMIGMTLFIIVSFLYPNGHTLRPEITGHNIFADIVRLLHSVDTPTNVLPSMHVYCAVVCMIAWWKDEELCRSKRWVRPAIGLLTLMIVLSTVFLKQHTVVDVVAALLLNMIVYYMIYVLLPNNYRKFKDIINFKEIMGMPNYLSMMRMVGAVVFLGIHVRYNGQGKELLLLTVLGLSALTDYLDGRIARKYDKVTEIGKILDPLADKITQCALLLYLFSLRREAIYLLIIFVVKEITVFLIGERIVLMTGKNDGARWYGKLNTLAFYIIMLMFIIWSEMPNAYADILMLICTGFMMLSLLMYIRLYRLTVRESERA